MKFLIQTIEGRVVFDFCFELERALEYQKWRCDESEIVSIYCSLEDLPKLNFGVDSDDIRDYTPVGSIEFTLKFCEIYLNPDAPKIIKPLNVPRELFPYRGGKIGNIILSNDTDRKALVKQFSADNDHIFIKSAEKLKYKENGHYNLVTFLSTKKLKEGKYQISEYIDDIETEYRCFIYHGELLGIQCYSGDFTLFPDISRVKEMISAYKAPPISYTLDVYVNSSGYTGIIECHEFWSCGFYGFSDYQHIPFMYTRGFNQLKTKLKNV